nr:hypothetical protein [Candidatus Sigynarchaeum springense]MDO8116212.1 hypothetical protein [Candidatus Sigynarchaeota archaeon]
MANLGAERYNVSCGSYSTAPFIDMTSITWVDDGTNYTITITFLAAIDLQKILDDDVWGGVQFSMNGSSVDNPQLVVNFEGAVGDWTAIVTDPLHYQYMTGVGSHGTNTITWSIPKSTLSFLPGLLPVGEWTARAFVEYCSVANLVIAWDVYNYPDFPSIHGITCVTVTQGIAGFDAIIMGLVSLAIFCFVAKRIVLAKDHA